MKVHGKPGDLVRLHSTVVDKGKHKLNHIISGRPYKATKKLSDVTYQLQHFQKRNQ